ncbi:CHAT domain-containing protein [Lactarius deliciosus]|nr:CHAT domain-containing protein [Lactarius deliciosus]
MDPKSPITDTDDYIAIAQKSLSLYRRSDDRRIIWVHILAMARFARYRRLRQKEDLDKSILHFTEAILLPPISRARRFLNVVQLLFRLALALLRRSEESTQLEDVRYSIEYLQYLRGLALESFNTPRNEVVTTLIQALAVQVQLAAGDGTRNIEEMVVLYRELLSSPDILTDFPDYTFNSLERAFNATSDRGLSIPLLDEAVECLRDAVKVCPPGSYNVKYALASMLCTRFAATQSNDDYEEAAALLERTLDPNQPIKCPDVVRGLFSSLVTLLAFIRSAIFQNSEYSEVAISRLRAELSSSSIDPRLRLRATEALVIRAGVRFRDYSLSESLEEAQSYMSQVVDLSSSQSLEKYRGFFTKLNVIRDTESLPAIQEKIQQLEVLLSNTPPGTKYHRDCLKDLADWCKAKFFRTDDISDIEQSINYNRLRLDSTHLNDQMRANSLSSLSDVLLLAFKHTIKTDYLDESIILDYDVLKLKNARYIHFQTIEKLASSLLIGWYLLGRTEDSYEAIRLMASTIDDPYVWEPDRFQLSCKWAFLARLISHTSILTAYKSAMSSMQKSLSLAPTISIQHAHLVAMGQNGQTMPLDYASYQISLGRFEEAIETLEQGRALIWSEMRGLRTPIAQLAEEDPPLVNRFAEVNQELGGLTISVTPSARQEMGDGVAQDRDWTDPFGRLVVKQQKLVEERDALISQIQGRSGLEEFLKTPSFTTLRSAALCGPIILINHCRWRSDILVLTLNSMPRAISTASDFYECANKLRDELVEARKHGLYSDKYQAALCSVLKVSGLVVPDLRLLFPSSPRDGPNTIGRYFRPILYFSDLYVPSYTPSLSALTESRKARPQVLDKPSLLLVAQPDDSLPGVWGEMNVVQALNARVTNLVSGAATPSSVVEGLRGNRFAHFACHGELEIGKPFEASFKLHGGSRLTLLDIVQSRLPDAEFAFLSCCHTAEITEDSIADEALHLTAAMQYCGFRSVVGTMWAMADTDGRDLAKSFYKSLFSGRRADVPYYERSAGALRDATRKLRKKRGITLERWVNFVHYGA